MKTWIGRVSIPLVGQLEPASMTKHMRMDRHPKSLFSPARPTSGATWVLAHPHDAFP